MPMLPIRQLGSTGVITDIDPYELPLTALSFGKNIRIENNKIERGGVFRTMGTTAGYARHLIGYFDSSHNNNLLYVDSSGNLYQWTAGGETSVSPSWSSSVSNAVNTHTIVNNVIYVNRADHVPFARSKDSVAAFAFIPTSTGGGGPNWDTTYRCQAIRSMNGMVVALNITKGAVSYPTMVKWSNFTAYNSTPPDWNVGSPSSSAGENILANMKGSLVDGALLRDRMMLYGTEETWYMDFIGGSNIFAFDRIFDFGIVNQNCVVEHEAIHYIFGTNDIKKTDGISVSSIADGRVRRFIFDTIIMNQAYSFFTVHNPALNEIMFCYVSGDAYCQFPANGAFAGCNRAAIYNYSNDKWYFADLPYVFHGDLVQPSSGAEWLNETTVSWVNMGGSWLAQAGQPQLNLVFAGKLFAGGQNIWTFDRIQAVSTVYPIDVLANSGAYLERDGLFLDEIKASLRDYKMISSIYPQGRLAAGAKPLRFAVGVTDHPNGSPTWSATQTFDQSVYYKIDLNAAGRYLAYRMFQDDFLSFTLTGFDADCYVLGQF